MDFKKKTAVALGTFDGLHKGHKSVITCALSFKEHGLIPCVLLFDSHPLAALCGKAPPEILQPSQRDAIIKNLGLETKTVEFNRIKDYSCREFFEKIILGTLNAGAVCCGMNFRFGKNNSGDCETLKTLCEEYSVKLKISPSVDFDGQPVSSTRIRKAIENGDIPAANSMLGREFGYLLTVVSGDQRGRLIGAPTINQHFDENFVIPQFGVYSSVAVIGETEYPGVTNIGNRPTFNGSDLRSETCILGFSGNLYGKNVEVRLLEYLRPEKKFESLEALGVQIKLDSEKSKKTFSMRGAK